MHQKPLSYTNLDSQFKKLGIKPIDNTPEEILDVVSEMLDRLKDQHEYPQDVLALQKKYAESFLEDNYAYYHQAKVGARFLKSFMKAENESFSNLLEKKSKIPLHTKVGGE